MNERPKILAMVDYDIPDPSAEPKLFGKLEIEQMSELVNTMLSKKGLAFVDTKTELIFYFNATTRFRDGHPVTIRYEADEYVASLADLNLYGSGDTEYDAFEMLKREISTLYDDLMSEDADNLGTNAKRWKDYLLTTTEKFIPR